MRGEEIDALGVDDADGLKVKFSPFLQEFPEPGVYLHGVLVAEPEDTYALVTLLHQEYVPKVLPTTVDGLTLEKIEPKEWRLFTHSHPRLFKEARRAATEKVAELAEVSPHMSEKYAQWAEPALDPSLEVDPENEEQLERLGEEETRLRTELAGARVGVLQRRAAAEGADPGEVEAALDSDDPRRALVALIVVITAGRGLEAEGKCARYGNSLLELTPDLAYAFTHRDDDILQRMQDEYGPKVGIYFAFLNCYTTSTGMLATIGQSTKPSAAAWYGRF